jgi:hypothetical protein
MTKGVTYEAFIKKYRSSVYDGWTCSPPRDILEKNIRAMSMEEYGAMIEDILWTLFEVNRVRSKKNERMILNAHDAATALAEHDDQYGQIWDKAASRIMIYRKMRDGNNDAG